MIWWTVFFTSLFWSVILTIILHYLFKEEDKEIQRWRSCAFKYMELFAAVCAEYEKQNNHLTALQNRDYISRN